VRLADLARLAGVPLPRSAAVASLGEKGKLNRATLEPNQISHPYSLLALRVNGAELLLDHGYPARIIAPAINGVHNTKWIKSIDFETN